MNKKEQIQKYFSECIANKEKIEFFAKEIGTSPKYVPQVLKARTYPPLTESNYIKAFLDGINTKKHLSLFFNKSISTIYRFEKRTNIHEKLDYCLNLQKSIRKTKGSLHSIMSSMKVAAEYYKQAEENIDKMERIIREMERLKM